MYLLSCSILAVTRYGMRLQSSVYSFLFYKLLVSISFRIQLSRTFGFHFISWHHLCVIIYYFKVDRTQTCWASFSKVIVRFQVEDETLTLACAFPFFQNPSETSKQIFSKTLFYKGSKNLRVPSGAQKF